MKLGNIKKLISIFIFIKFLAPPIFVFAEDKIQSIPLINLEELSPTFEEDKDELEKNYDNEVSLDNNESNLKETKTSKNEKVYINLKALDKITAKTTAIRLGIGEKNFFGSLEIKALKCQLSENNDSTDAVAYLQVKDISNKDNNQVFLFNGWTFASSPSLKPFDHPVYDIWLISC